jgi:hypothetical protein
MNATALNGASTAAAEIKPAEKIKIEILRLLHTGNASTPELTQSLQAEGYKVRTQDVCNHLATMKKWGWARVAETKATKLGPRPGKVPINVWTARHEIPTVEDIREARGTVVGRKSKKQAAKAKQQRKAAARKRAKAKTAAEPAPEADATPKTSLSWSGGDVMVTFERFTVSVDKAKQIMGVLK